MKKSCATLLLLLTCSVLANSWQAQAAEGSSIKILEGVNGPTKLVSLEGKLYATYVAQHSHEIQWVPNTLEVILGQLTFGGTRACRAAKAEAKILALELCRSSGGKDCRISLIEKDDPRLMGAEDIEGVSCEVTAYAIDMSHPVDEMTPISVCRIESKKTVSPCIWQRDKLGGLSIPY